AAPTAATTTADKYHDNNDDNDNDDTDAVTAPSTSMTAITRRRLVFAGRSLNQCVCRLVQPPVIIIGSASPEIGRDLVLDDRFCRHIWNRSFQTVPDGDIDLAVLNVDEDDDPVIVLLAADSPGPEDLQPVVFKRRIADIRHRDDHDLVAGAIVVCFQLLIERVNLVRREHVGIVIDRRWRVRLGRYVLGAGSNGGN